MDGMCEPIDETTEPRTVEIEEPAMADPWPPSSPLVRVINEDELARLTSVRKPTDPWENESMSFGESVTLLIAIGVLLYLIYALLWPQRF
jgi:K+-transporting ATPase KdpF subunit